VPYSLVLSESEVASVASIGQDFTIRFSAASLRKAPGGTHERALVGFGRGVVLELRAVRVIEESQPTFGRLAAGRLQVAGQWLSEVLLPFEAATQVQLELTFANRATLVVACTGVSVGFERQANFTESLAC